MINMISNKQIIGQILRSNFIPLNQKLVIVFGISKAYYLQYLLNQEQYANAKNGTYFTCPVEYITKYSGISSAQITRYNRFFENIGMIHISKKTTVNKNYYTINNNLIDFILKQKLEILDIIRDILCEKSLKKDQKNTINQNDGRKITVNQNDGIINKNTINIINININNITDNFRFQLQLSPLKLDNSNFSKEENMNTFIPIKNSLTDSIFNTFIPIVEFWNSMPMLRKHNLPKSKTQSCTKTIINASKYFKSILSGDFIEKYSVTNSDLSNTISNITVMDIKKAIIKLNELYYPKNEPVNKNILPKNIDEFFINFSGFSWFIELLNFTPKLKNTISIDSNIKNKYYKMLKVSTEQNKQMVDKKLSLLYNKYVEIDKNIGLVYSGWSKYDSYFSSWNLFTQIHLLYLKEYSEGISPGHINCYSDSKVWIRFKAWCIDNYNIELEPSPEKKNMIARMRKNFLIKDKNYAIDKFENTGYYTLSDNKYFEEGRFYR